MKLNLKYYGRSGLVGTGGKRILQMSPNLDRDEVSFDAPLKQPLRFREAISALHDIVINDLTFKPRDKTQYEEWKKNQAIRERLIRRDARQRKREDMEKIRGTKPPADLAKNFKFALKRYWKSRRALNEYLRKNNPALWRKFMPYDPVITVADDVLMFECFSADESSYGCLSVDRDCFGSSSGVKRGTTNVDYSWDLYDNFQTLRTYRETRFNINPQGFTVRTTDVEDYHEEKIDIPDGWLNGFMQLQSAMGIPMRKVSLSVESVYSLLAFLKRNKAKTSPRAIRFELADGKSPRMVLEPWEKEIVSTSTKYRGPNDEPIRIWGRRRLLTLARLLPLAERFDVYLLGTGLPSFWVAKMGNMRLTLGLSGWTANDWTKGSAVQMLLPQEEANDALIAKAADNLHSRRSLDFDNLKGRIGRSTGSGQIASALNQLALRGQVIYDLDAGVYRWRQVLPMAFSDKEVSTGHPELLAARSLLVGGKVEIKSRDESPRGGSVVTADVDGKPVECKIDADGMIKKGKCVCSWHYKSGIRNGPCRHIQAVRDIVFSGSSGLNSDWFEKRLTWAGG
jgi:hypothetical protein